MSYNEATPSFGRPNLEWLDLGPGSALEFN